jgi:hypothetical protein
MEPVSEIKGNVEGMGLNWDELKKGLTRVLPILELVANMTENPYDNVAVKFLKQLVEQPS